MLGLSASDSLYLFLQISKLSIKLGHTLLFLRKLSGLFRGRGDDGKEQTIVASMSRSHVFKPLQSSRGSAGFAQLKQPCPIMAQSELRVNKRSVLVREHIADTDGLTESLFYGPRHEHSIGRQ